PAPLVAARRVRVRDDLPVRNRLEPARPAARRQRAVEAARVAELEGTNPALLAVEHVEADVRCDPIEPRLQSRPTLEAVEPAPGTHHCLLDRVLGVEGRAEHPVAVPGQLSAVALELSLELL